MWAEYFEIAQFAYEHTLEHVSYKVKKQKCIPILS